MLKTYYNPTITLSLVMFLLMIAHISNAQKKVKLSTFRDCADCPVMIVIPAGTFTIGISARDTGHTSTEGPEKNINIRKFAAGKFDVTRKQWEAFVRATNRPEGFGCAFSGLKDTTRKSWKGAPDAS
jgi:formylglycine-generating enzyme required for sulfatase activity